MCTGNPLQQHTHTYTFIHTIQLSIVNYIPEINLKKKILRFNVTVNANTLVNALQLTNYTDSKTFKVLLNASKSPDLYHLFSAPSFLYKKL